jgi:hypothetical protein
MPYQKINVDRELSRLAQGKTTCHVPMLLHMALDDYPAIQQSIAKAFKITDTTPRAARR